MHNGGLKRQQLPSCQQPPAAAIAPSSSATTPASKCAPPRVRSRPLRTHVTPKLWPAPTGLRTKLGGKPRAISASCGSCSRGITWSSVACGIACVSRKLRSASLSSCEKGSGHAPRRSTKRPSLSRLSSSLASCSYQRRCRSTSLVHRKASCGHGRGDRRDQARSGEQRRGSKRSGPPARCLAAPALPRRGPARRRAWRAIWPRPRSARRSGAQRRARRAVDA